MNHVFILFLSYLETKPFPLPLSSLFLPSIACPEAKGNINFLALCPCPQSGADLAPVCLYLAPGTAWCVLVSQQPSPGAKPHSAPRAALQKEFSELPQAGSDSH